MRLLGDTFQSIQIKSQWNISIMQQWLVQMYNNEIYSKYNAEMSGLKETNTLTGDSVVGSSECRERVHVP